MGYTITIGNAVPKFSKDNGELYASWEVSCHAHDGAPTFPNDEMTSNTSQRSPSYSGWADFCRTTGLHEMFFLKDDGLMREHPGCQMLRDDHLLTIRGALKRWKAKSTQPPGFEGWPKFNEQTGKYETPGEGKYDATLARLIWLEYWVAWALTNCETPAIENS